MHRIGSYHSSALAHLVAAHLRENGVMAGVIDGSLSAISPVLASALNKGAYELVISSNRNEALARELVAQFEMDPPEIDPGWEDDVAPDLSMLDKALIPDCPECGWRIAIARPLGPCQRCGARYDAQEMIFEKHGPEALAPCYETEQPVAHLSDDEICAIEIDCPSCAYPLDGLGVRGNCPECGGSFDRRGLFNGLLGK
jgi:hypothetical protein